MSRQTVAVIIPTKNVATFFRPTLESIRFADEVIVVDMSSTDGTQDLCAEYPNVRVVDKVDYIYANVNTGFDAATTDWVIRLDSDEVLTPELQQEILDFLKNPPSNVNTIRFLGRHHMFGLPMSWGVGHPSRSMRNHMFRKGTARYPCKLEHEDLDVTPDSIDFTHPYDHYTNHTVEEVVQKFNYYTQRDVERLTRKSGRLKIRSNFFTKVFGCSCFITSSGKAIVTGCWAFTHRCFGARFICGLTAPNAGKSLGKRI